jgi:hypothetical protein
MDAVTFITKLQKFIRESYQNIGDAMISGTVDSMEKYKYMQGQANAYQTVIQEISNLLNKKEQSDEKGNVIDLGNGKGPKINLGLEEKYKEEAKTAEPTKEPLNPENIKAVVDELPTPSGWRILVLPFTPKEKTSGGINYCTRIIRPFKNSY